MFDFDTDLMEPTELDQALAAELRLFDTIRHAWLFPRVDARFNESTTAQLMAVWKTTLDGIAQSTRRITGARMTLPTRHVQALLTDNANPQAVDALQLIQFLPVLGASVQHGPIAALEMITVLVSAGYRISGEEVDAIAAAFGQSLHQHLDGAAWINTGCPPIVLHTQSGDRA